MATTNIHREVRQDPEWSRRLSDQSYLVSQLSPLPVTTPRPAPRETVYSYLSRIAATWRTNTADLAYDMGVPFKHFLNHEAVAIEALADWADLDQQEIDEMLSWTGVRSGNVRMRFRGELIVSRALRSPVMRGCPVCLREDADGHPGLATEAMVMRGHWQFRENVLCVRHEHPLVSLWKSECARERDDIGAGLHEIMEKMLSGALDQPMARASDYDLWLDRRLQDGLDETWFSEQPLFAATTFCRLLGAAMSQEASLDEESRRAAYLATGFNVARNGEEAIREAFNRMAARATGPLDEPNKAFAKMYPALARDYASEEGFDLFRGILRDCILDHWPIAPGEVILGETVEIRRFHSLRTAAKETGVGARVLEPFLIECGALPPEDDRPDSRRLFDARAHADLLAEIPTLVGPAEMCKAMGTTRREFLTLQSEGLLLPRTSAAKVKNPWRLSDGLGLVTELLADALPVNEDDADWETLLHARRRTGVTLSLLVGSIRRGLLEAGHRSSTPGFHGIVVLKTKVDDLAEDGRRRPAKAELPGLMSAAEFGRTVGLRDHGYFTALIEAGHTPALRVANPEAGRLQYRLEADHIAHFHRRFVTLTTLSQETGHHRNTLRSLLSDAAVLRFAPGGQNFGPIYLRDEVISTFHGAVELSPSPVTASC